MKCRGCGAVYDPQMENCPYCGRVNTRRRWQKAVLTKKQAGYEQEKEQVLKSSATEIRLRKLTRLVWILAGLTIFTFLVSFGIFMALGQIDSWQKAEPEYLQTLQENERWAALQNYLYDTDMETTQKEYWQLAHLAGKGEDLRFHRADYLGLDREEYRLALSGDRSVSKSDREYMESHFSFLLERLFADCADILQMRKQYTGESWMAELYGPLTEAGDELLQEMEAEARVTLKLLFGLSEEEIDAMAERYEEDSEETQAHFQRIKEAWLDE